MLVELRVRDLVLIEELTLTFAPGFTVLTGETGAGKSLVATAIGLLLGRKAGPEVVRHGAAEAEVEGLFDVTDETGVRARLVEAGLPDDGELLVRRILPAEGRQRCFVNGRIASLSLLGELSEGLASFSGQHEHLALLDSSRQLDLLDAYGDGAGGLAGLVSGMAERYAGVRVATADWDRLREAERDRAQRIDLLGFQLREIEEVSPVPGELDELGRRLDRAKHLELLLRTSGEAVLDLYEGDSSIFERLSGQARKLDQAAEHDPELAESAARMTEAAALVEEVARFLSDYSAAAETGPISVDELVERREALRSLTRKHGTDLDGVLAREAEIREEVARLARYEETLEEASRRLEEARREAVIHAAKLTAARSTAARKLARSVRKELSDLSLGEGVFEVRLLPRDGDPGPRGADRVELRVSLNPGEGTHPLIEVASGGELSRLMLALRRAAAGTGPVGTWVFDEVDAGIGGVVASAVGRKLKEVSAHHQVICVTHLAPIAGLADDHLHVAKSGSGGRTRTEVRRLTPEERVQEIARMLGGETLTEKTRAAARELLLEGGGGSHGTKH